VKTARPIGVFDSGVGGLTVAREINLRLPGEKILYFADTLHVPYGPRPAGQLVAFACRIVEFLVSQGAKLIVDACNSTSAVALPELVARFNLPVIGVIEPGVREALRQTRNGRIGVLGTEVTVSSNAHRLSLLSSNPGVEVYAQACPLLVPLVEAGEVDSPAARQAISGYLAPLLRADVDTIILGCTHYPFMAPLIREMTGERVSLVDPAAATADEVAEVLGKTEVMAEGSAEPSHTCLVSGPAENFRLAGRRLLGSHPLVADVRQVELDWGEEN